MFPSEIDTVISLKNGKLYPLLDRRMVTFKPQHHVIVATSFISFKSIVEISEYMGHLHSSQNEASS